jgi:hypothetical protein
MSSVIPRNCDDVIVNFCVRSQTIVKLQEFKEHVEEWERVVLSDEQAKTLFHAWLKMIDGNVDGQQVTVDVEFDSDDAMDSNMEFLWDTVVNDNIEIPDDWHVKKCINCEDISIGTYGDDKTPLCEEHKQLAGFNSDGVKGPELFDGCEHPSPEVKEVTIVSNKPEVIDFFDGKTVRDADMLALKDEVATLKAQVATLKDDNTKLKDRIRSVVKHFEQMIASII